MLTGSPTHGRFDGHLRQAIRKCFDPAPCQREEAVLTELSSKSQEDRKHVHGSGSPQIPPRGQHGLAMNKHVAEEDDGYGHVNDQKELVASFPDAREAGEGEHKEACVGDDTGRINTVRVEFGSQACNTVVGQRLVDEGDGVNSGEEKHEACEPLVIDLELLVTDASQERNEVDFGAEHIDERHQTKGHHTRAECKRWAAKAAVDAIIWLNNKGPDGKAEHEGAESQCRS